MTPDDAPAERPDLPPPWEPLPDPVRARVGQLAAQVLPAVGVLPPALRPVAAFTPQRRARLGGTQILAALLDDPDLRERVGTQVAARGPLAEVGRLVAATGAAEGAADELGALDPLDVAALLWLLRPEGGEEPYGAALARHAASLEDANRQQDVRDRDRLERRVADLEDELVRQRDEAKEQLDAARAENTALRRKLGEARAEARTARAEAEVARSGLADVEARAGSATTAAQGDVRRLRKQVEELQAELASRRTDERSGARAGREAATVRTRLLLETLTAAAQGLQRELALPPSEGTPGERLEAAMAAEGTRTTSAAGAMGTGSPALLEQLLSMPRARLLVDGYNVTKQTWGSASLEVQRMRLVNGLAPVVARTGAETTVVFDAASSPVRPVVAAPRGVRVAFSPENVIADDVIRDLVALEPAGRVVVVVTSDQAVARDVRRAGATVMDAVALAGLLVR
ncbi:NYN domain-containing protein [Nocardioides sp. ChNu-153]|uniref:NYN domain-containing protein n=1 Tax=unclassified Nocardioides TaxID=2615069 RepID=UPI002407243B|nr:MULTISPECIES: NYN domain-containing protein [unclassified Nocardioides]MDF9715927.1 NYN domain-containing protein [Nocardioides sp. ChNu-99]MDN7122920.1 NYN domain-containing protein [Nocardioides sp. ChNu-153]